MEERKLGPMQGLEVSSWIAGTLGSWTAFRYLMLDMMLLMNETAVNLAGA